jgi:hypothetical protein
MTGNLTGADVLASVPSGSNSRIGTFTLTGATDVVVANTLVTANTIILLTRSAVAGTPGAFGVESRVAGTSFTVYGTASDTSPCQYVLIEPAA